MFILAQTTTCKHRWSQANSRLNMQFCVDYGDSVPRIASITPILHNTPFTVKVHQHSRIDGENAIPDATENLFSFLNNIFSLGEKRVFKILAAGFLGGRKLWFSRNFWVFSRFRRPHRAHSVRMAADAGNTYSKGE